MEHATRVRCIGWKTYSYPEPTKYRGCFSIVLLAICAKCNFTLVYIGQHGSNNDSGVLANSTMG